jgi:hypothetical protein
MHQVNIYLKRFLMSMDNLKSNNNNTVFSLVNDQKINQFFENRETLTLFLVSEYQNNKNKLFSDIDIDKLYQEVKAMEDLIIKTNISFSKTTQKSLSIDSFLNKKEQEISTIKNMFYHLSLEEFINELIFSDIHKSKFYLTKHPLNIY